MKLIPYIPDIPVTHPNRKPFMVPMKKADGELDVDAQGNPTLDESGKPKMEQAKISQRDMFIEALSDPAIVQGKDPIAASRFLNKLYDAIADQSDEVVKARGGWKFEDEHADALCRSIKKGPAPTQKNPQGGYNVAVLHCLEPIFESVEKVTEWKEPVEAKPNGVEKSAPVEAAQA